MADTDGTPPSGPPPRQKRALPFKRTAPRRLPDDPFRDNPVSGAAASREDDDDSLSLFRRSKEVYPIAIEDQEQRVRRKEEQRRRTSIEHGEEQSGKRRRVSLEVDDDHAAGPAIPDRASPTSAGKDAGAEVLPPLPGAERAHARDKGSQNDNFKPEFFDRPRRPSDPADTIAAPDVQEPSPVQIFDKAAPQPHQAQGNGNSPGPIVIDLDDDGDPFANIPPTTRQKDADSGDSDVEIVDEERGGADEYDHYIVLAREREAKAQAAAKAAAEAVVAGVTVAGSLAGAGEFGTPDPARARRQLSADDPIITIMITSRIPSMSPLCVERKLSQNMRIVRQTWIAHQRKKGVAISQALEDEVFLTWKGNKIYNTTTGTSLGLQVNSRGEIMGSEWSDKLRPGYGRIDDGYHRGGLHLEVWSEELYAEYLREKERERHKTLGEVVDDEDLDELDGGGPARGGGETGDLNGGPDHGEKIRVILKAKELEPVKITAYAKTTALTMVAAFRSMRNIPAKNEISLRFDGEKLPDNSTIQDVEIEDMDTIEVYIK